MKLFFTIFAKKKLDKLLKNLILKINISYMKI